jgi:hypothetical protein
MIPVTDALGVQSEANSNRVQRDPFPRRETIVTGKEARPDQSITCFALRRSDL